MPGKTVVEIDRVWTEETERVELPEGAEEELVFEDGVARVRHEPDEDWWDGRASHPEELKELDAQGLDVEEMADEIDVSNSTVSRWLRRLEL